MKRLAIIGGGVAGLTAGYLLRADYDVTLFEKENRLGGNAFSYTTREGLLLDIAVAAFGKAGYPNFYRLLGELGVDTALVLDSYMSFHDLERGAGLYLTPRPSGLWAQRFDLLRPSKLKSILDVYLGVRQALRWLDAGKLDDLTVRQCLDRLPALREGDGRVFLLCTFCLLSSMSGRDVLNAPASFFFGKLKVHDDLISPRAVYSVRCVKGGTRRYVEKLAEGYTVTLGSRIETVARREDEVVLVMKDGEQLAFDAVIFGCNADQALGLLQQPTEREQAVLGAWRYNDGRLVVHRDHSSFPRRELLQAYTFLYTNRPDFETSVNGCLWHEPDVPAACDLFSSQYPNFPIDEKLIEFETVLRTPIFDHSSCAMIPELSSLNGNLRTYYCGSHFGYGLHEDAVTSAKAAVRCLRSNTPPTS